MIVFMKKIAMKASLLLVVSLLNLDVYSLLTVFPKIPSVLSQVHTLPALRDDLTALQHHPYQIQKLEDRASSPYLVKRDGDLATLYWDASGVIKAILNMEINYEVARLLEMSGASLGQSVLSDCHAFLNNPVSPAYFILTRATWIAQLGRNWRNILRRPRGATTMAITVILRPELTTPAFLTVVLNLMQQWFTQGGDYVNVVQVQSARDAGNAPANQVGGRSSLIEERAFGEPSSSRFCKSPIQNSPAMFTVGTFASLLTSPITC